MMIDKHFFNYKKVSTLLFVCFQLFKINVSFAQQSPENGNENIRLNQIGFYPLAPKNAIVLKTKETVFYVETINKKKVFTGGLKESGKPDFAGNKTSIADFTAFHQPGKYVLFVADLGYSWPFEIKNEVHADVANAAIKAYYFMRASIPL